MPEKDATENRTSVASGFGCGGSVLSNYFFFSPLFIILAMERQLALLGLLWGSDFETGGACQAGVLGHILGIMGNWGEPVL